MTKYEIIIDWNNEDQVFIAEVPELPGCMAHGDSEESALQQAKEAICYISTPLGNLETPYLSPKAAA